jgi:hypothetical protein
MPNERPLPPPAIPVQERMSAKQKELNTPMVCTTCGSSYFIEVPANQWATGGFGSVEFRLLSISGMNIKMCLCGEPIGPSPQGGSFGARSLAHMDFPESLRLAKEYRAKNTFKGIAEVVASKRELDDVKHELEGLRDLITKQLAELEASLPKDVAPEAVLPAPETPKATLNTPGQLLTNAGKTKGRQPSTPKGNNERPTS